MLEEMILVRGFAVFEKKTDSNFWGYYDPEFELFFKYEKETFIGACLIDYPVFFRDWHRPQSLYPRSRKRLGFFDSQTGLYYTR